jgi:hypothetical protein
LLSLLFSLSSEPSPSSLVHALSREKETEGMCVGEKKEKPDMNNLRMLGTTLWLELPNQN